MIIEKILLLFVFMIVFVLLDITKLINYIIILFEGNKDYNILRVPIRNDKIIKQSREEDISIGGLKG